MGIRMTAVVSGAKPEERPFVLPYCFRGKFLWKHAERLSLKSEVEQRLTGAPEGIRTPDPQIRSLVLYPAELPAPGMPPQACGGAAR